MQGPSGYNVWTTQSITEGCDSCPCDLLAPSPSPDPPTPSPSVPPDDCTSDCDFPDCVRITGTDDFLHEGLPNPADYSGDYHKADDAALAATAGSRHGPIEDTYGYCVYLKPGVQPGTWNYIMVRRVWADNPNFGGHNGYELENNDAPDLGPRWVLGIYYPNQTVAYNDIFYNDKFLNATLEHYEDNNIDPEGLYVCGPDDGSAWHGVYVQNGVKNGKMSYKMTAAGFSTTFYEFYWTGSQWNFDVRLYFSCRDLSPPL